VRMLELFHNNYQQLKETITGYSVTDDETINTIRSAFQQDQYILDPHGAVAYHALKEWLTVHPNKQGILLETAHPVKFPETVEAAIEKQIAIPDAILPLFAKQKQSQQMPASFSALKEWLLTKN